MSAFDETALIVLGAGLSSRFGSDKLATDLHGRPLATHLLTATSPLRLAQKILVARSQSWTSYYVGAGFETLNNPAPEQGQSSSLLLALTRVTAPNVLIMLADMPFVSPSHLLRVERQFRADPDRGVASSSMGRLSPPAMFKMTALAGTRLRGDTGARHLLNRAIAVSAAPGELRDIDHPQALVDPTL